MQLRIQSSSRKGKLRRWTELTLLVIGLTALGIWAGSWGLLFVWQDYQNWVFDREVSGRTATVSDYLGSKKDALLNPGSSEPKLIAPPSDERRAVAHNGLVGRLVIPRLRLRSIVREGADQDVLGLAVGHIPGTAFPGQEGGNVGVAGHRDTLFRGLRNIRQNDLIQFETTEGIYLYEVRSTQIVKPTEVSVLKPDSHSELTLVTCYPFNFIGSAPDRFIVKARQVPQSALSVTVDDGPAQAEAPVVRPVREVREIHEDRFPENRIPEDRDTGFKPAPAQREREKAAREKRITFEVGRSHSRQLTPGVSLGISDTNQSERTVNGWMWVMPDRRTVWLRNQKVDEPLAFTQDGKHRQLTITGIGRNDASGYLLMPAE